MMKKRIPTAVGSLAIFSGLSWMLGACTVSIDDNGTYNASAQIHRELPAAGVKNIVVSNVSGRIDVEGSSRSNINVSALVRARDKNALEQIVVATDRTDGTLRIRTRYPNRFFSFGSHISGRVDYTIRAPRELAVNVSNVDGAVKVNGVSGDVGAGSVSGDIDASTDAGSLNLKTTSGSITGRVHTLASASQLVGVSVSGDISFNIPKRSNATISARSVSGDFSSNLGLPKPNQTVGLNLSADLHGGGSKISFSTVSGSMTLTGF